MSKLHIFKSFLESIEENSPVLEAVKEAIEVLLEAASPEQIWDERL